MFFYDLLLRLVPASFRGEYGSEMSAVFARRQRDAAGLGGRLIIWIDAFLDILITAAQAHWDIAVQDLRYGVRTFRRAPGFAITAIVVMALGVGATTAAFSITDHVLLRPLPFPHADRLVTLWEDQRSQGYSEMEPSPPNYVDWKRMNRSFETMGATAHWSPNMVGTGNPVTVIGEKFTSEILPMLGAKPELGRLFTADDCQASASQVVLISHRLWQDRFGGSAEVLGRKLLLDGAPYTVIGVMPPEFLFPVRDRDLWTPLIFESDDLADRTNYELWVYGRLKSGFSIARAQSDMDAVGAALRSQYPKENYQTGVAIRTLRNMLNHRSRAMIWALLGASACVLLIACTNLANLLIARAMQRQKEIAVRAAMGAGRERLVRQLLTESLLLSLCGGLVGIAIAAAVVQMMARLVPTSLPISEIPAIDGRIMLFALLVTVCTGVLFGVAPALRACNTGTAGLQEGSRQGVGGRKERLRSTLVVGEILASVVLLVSSGLLIRALWNIQKLDPGFRPTGAFSLETILNVPKYSKTARRTHFYDQVISEVEALPGVKSAGYITFLPLKKFGGVWPVEIAGKPPLTGFHHTAVRFVTPHYFAAMEITLLAGRGFKPEDNFHAPRTAVVSESFARQYWPKEDPIGRHFNLIGEDRTVVGVVKDVRFRGLDRPMEPQAYLPYEQVEDANYTWLAPKDLVVRANENMASLLPAVRRIVAKADPELPIQDVETLQELVDSDSTARVLQIRVLLGFAVVAVLLAGIGIHGLLSFTVSSRTQEIGVRMAVGATSGNIAGLILGDAARLAVAGVIAGSLIAYWAGQGLTSLLEGVKPDDPTSFLTAIALCSLMTFAGSLAPAIRAIRVDPIGAIRSE